MAGAKKYICIVKVENEKFVRYHTNDLLSFTKFLDRRFDGWRWFNVFSNERGSKGQQLGSFTKNSRPTVKHIER